MNKALASKYFDTTKLASLLDQILKFIKEVSETHSKSETAHQMLGQVYMGLQETITNFGHSSAPAVREKAVMILTEFAEQGKIDDFKACQSLYLQMLADPVDSVRQLSILRLNKLA